MRPFCVETSQQQGLKIFMMFIFYIKQKNHSSTEITLEKLLSIQQLDEIH